MISSRATLVVVCALACTLFLALAPTSVLAHGLPPAQPEISARALEGAGALPTDAVFRRRVVTRLKSTADGLRLYRAARRRGIALRFSTRSSRTLCGHTNGCAVVGKPLVVFPDTFKAYSPSQIAGVFAHELAHELDEAAYGSFWTRVAGEAGIWTETRANLVAASVEIELGVTKWGSVHAIGPYGLRTPQRTASAVRRGHDGYYAKLYRVPVNRNPALAVAIKRGNRMNTGVIVRLYQRAGYSGVPRISASDVDDVAAGEPASLQDASFEDADEALSAEGLDDDSSSDPVAVGEDVNGEVSTTEPATWVDEVDEELETGTPPPCLRPAGFHGHATAPWHRNRLCHSVPATGNDVVMDTLRLVAADVRRTGYGRSFWLNSRRYWMNVHQNFAPTT